MIRHLAAAALVLVAAPLSADPATETEHTVQSGETLGGIANRAGVPRLLIIEANGLKEPYNLRAGQKLIIPRRRSHTVKEGETGFGIAMDYGVPWIAIAQASGVDPKAPVKVGQELVIPTIAHGAAPAPQATATPTTLRDTAAPRYAWPVTGRIRRTFNGSTGDDKHDGIDIVADRGTAVRASAGGQVIFAGQGPEEYGLTVILFHGGKWTTTYSFLDKVTVKEGDTVKPGERIGLVGDTGLATTPQLHFEIRRNKVPLDPKRYLPKP